jgi:protein-disulfide isomerase
MPSGKQSKRRRQAAMAPPPPKAPGARRQASPRVLIAAAAVVVLVVVAIILAVVLTGGSSGSSSATASKLPDATEVQQLLAGIPQNDNVLGKPSAPVTMVEYVDLQCPFCREFEAEPLPALISKYVRKGNLKIEMRIIAFIGGDSQHGREAALAAGMQNKLFNFTQLLYNNQGAENTGWLDDNMIKSAAASIPGLDANRLLNDRNSSAVKDRLSAMDTEASGAGVKSTPTILVGRSGTTPKRVTLTSPSDVTPVAAAVDAALAQS